MRKTIEWMIKGGAPDEDILQCLKLSQEQLSTLYGEHPEMLRPREDAAIEIRAFIEGLEKRAKGYEVEESEVIAVKNGQPVRIRKTKRHVPPSIEAAKLLMRYRSGDW